MFHETSITVNALHGPSTFGKDDLTNHGMLRVVIVRALTVASTKKEGCLPYDLSITTRNSKYSKHETHAYDG